MGKGRWTERQKYKVKSRQSGRYADIGTDKQTDRSQTRRQSDRQAARRANRWIKCQSTQRDIPAK